MLLSELVRTSAAVASTAARRAKVEEISVLLAAVPPGEVPVAVAFLSGELRQRQIGVGYAALGHLFRPAGTAPGQPAAGQPAEPSLTLADTDAVFAAIGAVTGQGAQAERRRLLAGLLSRATDGERSFLFRLLTGDLGQGAQEGIMTEAIARAAGVPAALVRRAHQLGGSLPEVAQAALGEPGGPDADRALAALRSFTLRVGRPLRPMLAAAAATIGAAMERISPAAVEWKIDGIRIQVHKNDGEVTVFTRTLDDITTRVPEIAHAVRGLAAAAAVLDGEAVALFPDGRPRPFQVTSGRAASHDAGGQQRADLPLTPFFFDLLHLDGTDLIDAPGRERHRLLSRLLPAGLGDPAHRHGESGHRGRILQRCRHPRPRGRRRQIAGWQLRGRPPGQRVDQGKTKAHP